MRVVRNGRSSRWSRHFLLPRVWPVIYRPGGCGNDEPSLIFDGCMSLVGGPDQKVSAGPVSSTHSAHGRLAADWPTSPRAARPTAVHSSTPTPSGDCSRSSRRSTPTTSSSPTIPFTARRAGRCGVVGSREDADESVAEYSKGLVVEVVGGSSYVVAGSTVRAGGEGAVGALIHGVGNALARSDAQALGRAHVGG